MRAVVAFFSVICAAHAADIGAAHGDVLAPGDVDHESLGAGHLATLDAIGPEDTADSDAVVGEEGGRIGRSPPPSASVSVPSSSLIGTRGVAGAWHRYASPATARARSHHAADAARGSGRPVGSAAGCGREMLDTVCISD